MWGRNARIVASPRQEKLIEVIDVSDLDLDDHELLISVHASVIERMSTDDFFAAMVASMVFAFTRLLFAERNEDGPE